MPRPEPTRRVILLGASNLTLAISIIVETAQLLLGEPLDVMVAMGHGRSYGQKTNVLGRKISGISRSGLWKDLARRPPLPTYALVTDIGNDILYNVPVERLIGSAEMCLDRLAEAGATTVVTGLPLDAIRTLGPIRFKVFRTLIFPCSRLTLRDGLTSAEAVQRRLTAACQVREIGMFPEKTAWFGLDPIHLRRRVWRTAWPEILSTWNDRERQLVMPRGSLRRWFHLVTRVPHERSIWFIKQSREQPSGRLKDGTLISMY